MKSDTIGALAAALAKAQGEMQNALKDKENPFFKSTYADLAAVWDACRGPLSKNGLSVVQTLNTVEGKIVLTSMLLHASGEWISSDLPIQPVKNDPQGTGSAITYARRFALGALVGIAAEEDDDGNSASGNDSERVKTPAKAVSGNTSPVTPKKPESPVIGHPGASQGDRQSVIKEIVTLQTELQISTDDLKAEVYEEFKVDSMKDLTIEQLHQLLDMLYREKVNRAKPNKPIVDNNDAPWLQNL